MYDNVVRDWVKKYYKGETPEKVVELIMGYHHKLHDMQNDAEHAGERWNREHAPGRHESGWDY